MRNETIALADAIANLTRAQTQRPDVPRLQLLEEQVRGCTDPERLRKLAEMTDETIGDYVEQCGRRFGQWSVLESRVIDATSVILDGVRP